MSDTTAIDRLRSLHWHVVNNTVNKEVLVGLIEDAIKDAERCRRGIQSAMGCLDSCSQNPDERLAWLRLYDAEEGREARGRLPKEWMPKSSPLSSPNCRSEP
jgi:hypothetical protein